MRAKTLIWQKSERFKKKIKTAETRPSISRVINVIKKELPKSVKHQVTSYFHDDTQGENRNKVLGRCRQKGEVIVRKSDT